MKRLTIIENVAEPETWEVFEVDSILDFLMGRYQEWPNNAHFYYNTVSEANDITPSSPEELELVEQQDEIIVVLYPSVVAAIVAVVAVAVGVAVAYFMMPSAPSNTQKNTVNQSPNNDLTNRTNKPRPNARIPDPYGEVNSTPDMLGQPYTQFINHQEVELCYMCVGRGEYEADEQKIYDETTLFNEVSGASLELYAPYTSPNSGHVPQLRIGDPINLPVETVYKLSSVNGQTLRSPNDNKLVTNSNIVFHYPNGIEALNTGDTKKDIDFTKFFNAGDVLTISKAEVATAYVGSAHQITAYSNGSIAFPLQSNSVPSEFLTGGSIKLSGALFLVKDINGYVTKSYDLSGTYTSTTISVITSVENVGTELEPQNVTRYHLRIQFLNPSSINPKWNEADGVTSTSSAVTAEVNSAKLSLDGDYTLTSVSSTYMTLSAPSSVNGNWSKINVTEAVSPTLSTSGDKWVGPFTVPNPETTALSLNFIASNGLFKDNGEKQERLDVVIEVEATRVNDAGDEIASPIIHQITLEGSSTNRTTRAGTLRIDDLPQGLYKVRARRVTSTDLKYKGSIIDEVKWRELFSLSAVEREHFGNVTTLQVLNYATTGALTMKERKVNGVFTRLVHSVDENYNLLPVKVPSKNIADILLDVSLDPYIGRRKIEELDVQAIYQTRNEVLNYFGTEKAFEFCYTFDKSNLSYEETAVTIAQAGFCEVYRQGNLIQLFFEKQTDATELLFNHRNILPETDKLNFRFGNLDDYDGVVYSYTNPKEKDTLDKITVSDEAQGVTPTNPKEVEGVGIRNRLQAFFHASRIWNKIKYQNVSLTFDATQEGELLLKGSPILVSELLTNAVSSGYVKTQNLLSLTLSQPFTPQAGKSYGVHLQLPDGTVANIPINSTADSNTIVLTQPPSIPLNLDPDGYSDTRYTIYSAEDSGADRYLVSERKTNQNLTTSITAYNYEDLYYSEDKSYSNGNRDIDGYSIKG